VKNNRKCGDPAQNLDSEKLSAGNWVLTDQKRQAPLARLCQKSEHGFPA
jgi:hypothetical protein